MALFRPGMASVTVEPLLGDFLCGAGVAWLIRGMSAEVDWLQQRSGDPTEANGVIEPNEEGNLRSNDEIGGLHLLSEGPRRTAFVVICIKHVGVLTLLRVNPSIPCDRGMMKGRSNGRDRIGKRLNMVK